VDRRSALLDGEIAVVLPDGRTDFHALQGASGHVRGLTYFLFDVLYLDGVDLASETLELRKERLRTLLGSSGPLRYADHVIGHGAEVFEAAKRLRTEGVVSKLRGSPHRPGRGTDWLKTKVVQRHPFVVAGYLVSAGAPLAAMLAGYYDDAGQLFYAGKVGTGFQKVEQGLLTALRGLATTTCPFSKSKRPRGSNFREARWVRPELVAEIEFLEWTPDGHFRHPTFKGLRDDKKPETIRRTPTGAGHEP
jgi:bifunctional non-homologous end joining protein LigD